jgi:chorismate mutase-like protein
MRINDWRRKIDAIDTAMLHLLNLRAELALEVGRLKDQHDVGLRVPAREQQILARMKRLNSGPLSDQSVEKIYQMILDESIHTQEKNGYGKARSLRATSARSPARRRKAAAA